MAAMDLDVVIVGAGPAGLVCANHLVNKDVSFLILEADDRIGGRLKSDLVNGFILNHGFQVLQTAYTEPRRYLDYPRLQLHPFAPGAIIRINGRFHRLSDPIRRPQDLVCTLMAPVGTLTDRLRLARMVYSACRGNEAHLFEQPDLPTKEWLRHRGISTQMIERFLAPFFSGVCLDEQLGASSRVFNYILRVFASGDIALPGSGMGAIIEQLAEKIPNKAILNRTKVQAVRSDAVVLASGETIRCRAVVLATEGPEVQRLLEKPVSISSKSELCLYFSAAEAPIHSPYLLLNGEGTGVINSVTVPSVIAPAYAPKDQALISVVLVGQPHLEDQAAEATVRSELTDWFGSVVQSWRHLKTYRIAHALPAQPPPLPNPTIPATVDKAGIYVCGEYRSVPGIQWAMRSGRTAAEAVLQAINQKT